MARSQVPLLIALRAVGAALAMAAAGIASDAQAAEPAPLVVMPFHTRCFDAAALVGAVHKRVPGVSVSVGVARLGRQRARVREVRGQLTVELEARDDGGHLLASERRIVPAPADEECGALLDLVSLIVARAAVPLQSAALPDAPPLPPPPPSVAHEHPVEHRPHPVKPSEPPTVTPESTPPQPSTQAATPEAAPPEPSSSSPPRPSPSEAPVVPPRPVQVRAAPPAAPRIPWPGPSESLLRRRVLLSAAFAWLFPVTGANRTAQSVAAGFLSADYRFRYWGVALHIGVTADDDVATKTTSAPSGMVTIAARRLPLAVELHVDLPLWPLAGRVHLGAGPELLVWLTGTEGLLHNETHALLEPALLARASYQLDRGRVSLQLGAQLDVAFITDGLAIGGVGTLAHTPRLVLGPFLALGLGL